MIKYILISTVFLVAGCTVSKQFIASGGDRSAGTITLSLTYGMMQKVKTDPEATYQEALSRCAAWGYSDAEPFGFVETKCIQHDGTYCLKYMMSIDYQCID